MSAELHRFGVAATIADPDHWAPESLAAAEAAGSWDYRAWAMAELRERVAAGAPATAAAPTTA